MQINLFKAPLAESRRSWLWALEKTKHKETKGDEARGNIKEREKQTINYQTKMYFFHYPIN